VQDSQRRSERAIIAPGNPKRPARTAHEERSLSWPLWLDKDSNGNGPARQHLLLAIPGP